MNNKLLDTLRVFPPNRLYLLSSSRIVERAFVLFRDKPIRSFRWDRTCTLLTVSVSDRTRLDVEFYLVNGAVSYSCDCPESRTEKCCEHIICALLTIKNVFSPKTYGIGKYTPAELESLKKMLIPVRKEVPEKRGGTRKTRGVRKEEKEDIRFFFEPDMSGRLKISFQKEGLQVTPYSRFIPPEVKPLLSQMLDYYDYRISEEVFLKYLGQWKTPVPLALEWEGETIQVEWDPSLKFTAKTRCHLRDNRVTLSKVCCCDSRETGNLLSLGPLFMVDLTRKKLGILQETKGWELWNVLSAWLRDNPPYGQGVDSDDEFDDEFDDDTDEALYTHGFTPLPVSLTLSRSLFNGAQITVSEKAGEAMGDDVIFESDGSEYLPRIADPDYRITITQSEETQEMMILRAECVVEGEKDLPAKQLFGQLLSLRDYSSSFIRAKKRRRHLYDAFIALLSCGSKKEVRQVIRDTLKGEEFRRQKIKREARAVLHAFSVMLDSPPLLRIGGYNNRFHFVRTDFIREGALYRLPYRLFGFDLFDAMTGAHEMGVSAGNVQKQLHALKALLEKENIALWFKGKPVVSSDWDFTFVADRKGGVDWFEIRPEIQCNGKEVSTEEFLKLLQQDGVDETDDEVRVLDSNTQKILTIMTGMVKGAGDGVEKEFVRTSRLQILDWIALRKEGVTIKLPREDEELIRRLFDFKKIGKYPLPRKLKGTLRHYQKEGYYWLAFLYEHRFGACLADDMGLGKTLQAITLLGAIKERKVKPPSRLRGIPHLIVVPPTLLCNWQLEIEKFYPSLKVLEYAGINRRTDFKGKDVIITTYDIVRRDSEKFEEYQFHIIIFDETQAIKNIYAARTSAARRLKGCFKISMTGTPLENHLGEYYSILDISLPGLLGEYEEFDSLMKKERPDDIQRLVRRTRPFLLRRTKDKVLKELPKKVESDIYLELTERQKALYKRMVQLVKSEIDEAYREKNGAQARIIALTAILRLRQICVSPGLVDPDHKEASPKVTYLLEKVRELIEEGHRALIFSQFTSFLDIVERELNEAGIPYYRMDGKTPVRKRAGLIKRFQEEDGVPLFLLSLKTGGVGLNLTMASYVFHLDPWWNPAVENQASDRAHRIGQKKKVFITRLLMRHTIEEKMMKLKAKKSALYKAVMEDDSTQKRGVSIRKADFDFLLN